MLFPKDEGDLENGLCALARRTANNWQLEVEFRGAEFLRGDRLFEAFLQNLPREWAMVKFVDVEGNTIYSWRKA